jgi:hypothetical protein
MTAMRSSPRAAAGAPAESGSTSWCIPTVRFRRAMPRWTRTVPAPGAGATASSMLTAPMRRSEPTAPQDVPRRPAHTSGPGAHLLAKGAASYKLSLRGPRDATPPHVPRRGRSYQTPPPLAGG